MQTKILPQDFFAREKGAVLIIFKLFFGECRHCISHHALINLLFFIYCYEYWILEYYYLKRQFPCNFLSENIDKLIWLEIKEFFTGLIKTVTFAKEHRELSFHIPVRYEIVQSNNQGVSRHSYHHGRFDLKFTKNCDLLMYFSVNCTMILLS